jgi:hypothetical protein
VKLPLACGADHNAKWGVDGYGKSDHWCALACANIEDCGAIWKCIPGQTAPMRLQNGTSSVLRRMGAIACGVRAPAPRRAQRPGPTLEA